MPVYLKALALRNYRGIGNSIQTMPNFKTFNFFIGANNAGKSTVLNFISRHLPKVSAMNEIKSDKPLDSLEVHGSAGSSKVYMAMGFSLADALHQVRITNPDFFNDHTNIINLEKLLKHLAMPHDMIWKGSDVPYTSRDLFSIQNSDAESLSVLLRQNQWQYLWTHLTRRTGGALLDHWIPETIQAIGKALDMSTPTVRLIPAIRQIGPKDAAFEDFSGVGLIQRLAALQNPEHNKRSDRATFNKINTFLQSVTAKPEAEIEIPFSRDHVLVHMDNRVLPLASLGTGIHEVVMIAAFCTLAEHEIVCIEEPELHLHPLIQRKLIAYLAAETKNQYFIATHSAAFIDTPGAAIFHVTQESGTTHIREAVLRQERFAICTDLGHRASDIVQANAVVWVEGPSDRTYLNHWIGIADARLVEGIHYSVMFYGGRLLSHLSANDEEVSEFIQLRNLNRNIAIIMDSDKATTRAFVNATKLRLKSEFEQHGGIAWITKGREIENYIHHDRLQRAVKAVYGERYAEACGGGQFDHALFFQRANAKRHRKAGVAPDLIERDVDKVKVSKAVAGDGAASLDVLDLREKVHAVVDMIRRANDMQEVKAA